MIEDEEPLPTKEDMRRSTIKRLSEIYTEQKYLDNQKKSLLVSLSDEDELELLYLALNQAHKGILDSEPNESLSEILVSSVETEEGLKTLLTKRNNKFFRGIKVYEENMEHPMQKELVKNKLLCRRQMKKQSTPGQHMKYVKDAKDSYSKDKNFERQLQELSEALQKQAVEISQLKLGQKVLRSRQDDTDEKIDQILSKIGVKITDTRKIQAYLMKEGNASVPDIANNLSVDNRTIYRWIRQIKKLLE